MTLNIVNWTHIYSRASGVRRRRRWLARVLLLASALLVGLTLCGCWQGGMPASEQEVPGLKETLTAFEAAIASDPENVQIYLQRGNLYRSQGAFQEAIHDYNRAIELDPDNELLYIARGLAHLAQNDEAALEDMERAVAVGPDNAVAYHNRGVVHYDRGETRQAIADYDRALALNPDLAGTHYNRALAYYLSGQEKEAEADLVRYLEMSDDETGRKGAQQLLRTLQSPKLFR